MSSLFSDATKEELDAAKEINRRRIRTLIGGADPKNFTFIRQFLLVPPPRRSPRRAVLAAVLFPFQRCFG
jgi:hypothetical protein